MDVSAVNSQFQMSLLKKVMDQQTANMQNMLAALPQSLPSASEPGKGQNVDIRV